MKKFLMLISLLLFLFLIGCDSDENPVDDEPTDIPPDPSGVTVPTPVINNIQPTSNFAKSGNNPNRVLMNVTGMINPVTNQPIQLSYNPNNPSGSNIFVTEDNVVKGLKVSKVSSGNILQADVVFTVDNSGSMSQEADSVAAGIIKFANFLTDSGLDVKFGIVGYSSNVNGGINFTSATTIETYLNRSSGTSRTRGFSGADSAALETASFTFGGGSGENGVEGVLFADSNFTWRSSAQRVFINFTDEPTQSSSGDTPVWNTAHMCAEINGRATVHTVFSNDSTAYSWTANRERPWDMSTCTGGTVKFIDTQASGLDLRDLPVAGALANSYLVEFLSSNGNAAHNVVITVKESSADGQRVYTNLMY
ncbi:MAG: VWA domain-containing protein [Ignavibacteriae bacterium]|nr:VWA domain-containing protein [Ignavibacteriota bacterium]NOG98372.1 VWA domain-containing protein [Ignavibacteriota bacterium]